MFSRRLSSTILSENTPRVPSQRPDMFIGTGLLSFLHLINVHCAENSIADRSGLDGSCQQTHCISGISHSLFYSFHGGAHPVGF